MCGFDKCVWVCKVKLSGGWQDLQQVMPHAQASVNEGGERAPEVCGWVKSMANLRVGGGGRGVGEGPVEQQVGELWMVSNVCICMAGEQVILVFY